MTSSHGFVGESKPEVQHLGQNDATASLVGALKVLVRVRGLAGGRVGDVACSGGVSLAAGRGQVLEHGRAVSGEHLRQLNGLRLHPEEVVAQRLV